MCCGARHSDQILPDLLQSVQGVVPTLVTNSPACLKPGQNPTPNGSQQPSESCAPPKDLTLVLGGRSTSFTFTTLRMRAMMLQTQVAARIPALTLESIPPPTCKDSPSPQLTPHGWVRHFGLPDNEAILAAWLLLAWKRIISTGSSGPIPVGLLAASKLGHPAILSTPSLEDFQYSFFSTAFSPAAPQVPLCLDPNPAQAVA